MSETGQQNRFIQWRHTAIGRICWAILTGVIAYLFITLAIDSGELWQWAIAALFTIDCLYNFVQLTRKLVHGRQKRPA